VILPRRKEVLRRAGVADVNGISISKNVGVEGVDSYLVWRRRCKGEVRVKGRRRAASRLHVNRRRLEHSGERRNTSE
jgi:hypothetical protein